jgi:tetratricopeptide (TPR) repeat protein
MVRVLVIISSLVIIGCLNQNENKSLQDLGPEIGYYLENGDTLTAIQILEEFIEDNPDNNETKGALIVLKIQSGLTSKEEGFGLLHELYLKDSTNIWLRELNALRVIEQGTEEEGLAEIEEMITDDPSNFWNYIEKGRKLIELKKYDEATIAFNKAIELEPLNRWAYAERAFVKYMKGDKQGACEEWRTPGGGAISYYEKYCK